MCMNVNIYTDSANHPRFAKMLNDFAVGVRRVGDNAHLLPGKYQEADVHVIFGSWKDRDKPWHNVKRDVVAKAQKYIVIETPLVGRGEVKDVGDDVWYRVGLNGFLADTGNFNNKRRPADRWEIVQQELGVEIKPYREDGEFILLTLQVPGDASLRGLIIEDWAYETAHKIRQYTDRPILIRTPQVMKTFNLDTLYKIRDELPNIDYQVGDKQSLIPTLEKCWATVAYSSGMGIDSYINGVPCFTMDKANFGYSLGNTNLKNIENPKLPKREQWLNNLCYAQWSEQEMNEGLAWRHMKEIL